MAATKPDLLIGIDVGMTCTGVAWVVRNDSMVMTEPHVISKWPGATARETNKVPTQLCYRHGQLSSWGFSVNHEDDTDSNPEFVEWFKIYLDPKEYKERKQKNPSDVPATHESVRRYYRDYLQELCKYIEKQLEEQVRSWRTASVEFSFSVPTTWTTQSVISDFKQLARDAGFGKAGNNHSVQVGLTEAEAAAVYTLKAQSAAYEDGDVILIIDAGGGTTDLALLKVHKKPHQAETLQALDMVRGDEIGSVEIDTAFEELATRRLTMIKSQLRRTPEDVAWEMTRRGFQHHKEEFGTDSGIRQDRKAIAVPGLSDSFDSDEPAVTRGRMFFTNHDIQALFDIQMRKMFKLVDHQIGAMARVAPQDEITHIILSGGLGSSEYVKSQLRARYIANHQSIGYCSRNLRIITSSQPQLAVAKGLIQDRMQKLSTTTSYSNGQGILATRICRQSYGIVCHKLYHPEWHQGQQTWKDPVDGQVYVTQQIAWLIQAGQPISTDAIEHSFYRTFLKAARREPWISKIASSHNKGNTLPQNLHRDGAKVLCTMKSDLTNVPLESFEKVKKHWWQCGSQPESHYKVNYEVRFLIRPAGIEFELWFAGNQYNESGSFDVKWEEGAQVAAPKEHKEPPSIPYDQHMDYDRDQWSPKRYH